MYSDHSTGFKDEHPTKAEAVRKKQDIHTEEASFLYLWLWSCNNATSRIAAAMLLGAETPLKVKTNT